MNKKISLLMLSIVSLTVLNSSCNKTKTYAEYLAEEKDAIKELLKDSDFVVLNRFPTDGKFKANEFFKDDDSGVYFNIIDRGDVTLDSDGNLDAASAVAIGEEVYVRYSGLIYFKNDTTKYSNMLVSFPEEFKYYGTATTLNMSTYYSSTYGNATTPGWTIPLKYVGHNGQVKMIIPFNFGDADYAQAYYEPAYYNLVKYRLSKHIK
ncbi:MAG: DUF4827 domain-containing protein [Dysgonamonadaceae bacterium]|nr:DUF4827 domain-containing protein [Dysgonamonadaceae bacterium]